MLIRILVIFTDGLQAFFDGRDPLRPDHKGQLDVRNKRNLAFAAIDADDAELDRSRDFTLDDSIF